MGTDGPASSGFTARLATLWASVRFARCLRARYASIGYVRFAIIRRDYIIRFATIIFVGVAALRGRWEFWKPDRLVNGPPDVPERNAFNNILQRILQNIAYRPFPGHNARKDGAIRRDAKFASPAMTAKAR